MTKERGQTAKEIAIEEAADALLRERFGITREEAPTQYHTERWRAAVCATVFRNAALEEAADVIFNESVKHYAEGKSISDPYLSAVQLARADGLALASSAIRSMKEPLRCQDGIGRE